jgi:nicotinate-nucleotide adenylyltransferase
MKVGLYFGTFNPIHVGHLIIANHLAEETDLDEVWLVVTPHNPHKNKQTLLADHHRYEMVYRATERYAKLKPCDIEFKLKQPNYTAITLAYLQEKYPQHEFGLIMGQDNLQTFHKWRNYEYILENYKLYVYPRVTEGALSHPLESHGNVHSIKAPIIELSSTAIRQQIKDGKNVAPMLPEEVYAYVTHNLFYKN